MVSHVRKHNIFEIPCPQVYDFVQNYGLLPLCTIGYDVVDKGLLKPLLKNGTETIKPSISQVGEMTNTGR